MPYSSSCHSSKCSDSIVFIYAFTMTNEHHMSVHHVFIAKRLSYRKFTWLISSVIQDLFIDCVAGRRGGLECCSVSFIKWEPFWREIIIELKTKTCKNMFQKDCRWDCKTKKNWKLKHAWEALQAQRKKQKLWLPTWRALVAWVRVEYEKSFDSLWENGSVGKNRCG